MVGSHMSGEAPEEDFCFHEAEVMHRALKGSGNLAGLRDHDHVVDAEEEPFGVGRVEIIEVLPGPGIGIPGGELHEQPRNGIEDAPERRVEDAPIPPYEPTAC